MEIFHLSKIVLIILRRGNCGCSRNKELINYTQPW